MDLASARIALRANMTRGRTLFLSQSFLLFNHLPQEVQDKIIRLLLPARPAAFHRVDFQLMSIYNKHVDTTTTQELRNAVKIALVFKQFHAVYKTHVLAYLPRGYIISLWSDAEYIRTTWLSGSRPILPPKPWDKVNVDVRVSRGLYDGNCVVFHMRVEHVLNCLTLHVNTHYVTGHGPECLVTPRVGPRQQNVFLRTVGVEETDVEVWDSKCRF